VRHLKIFLTRTEGRAAPAEQLRAEVRCHALLYKGQLGYSLERTR
jgi:hypothetical protein